MKGESQRREASSRQGRRPSSLRRDKQLALIQPSTKTPVDVGIKLKGAKPTGRLEAPGSFDSRVTHRVRVRDKVEVDKGLIGWLKEAYASA